MKFLGFPVAPFRRLYTFKLFHQIVHGPSEACGSRFLPLILSLPKKGTSFLHWELVESNPMQLVRVKNVSKRLERPSVLTAEEFHKLLLHVREPYRTMVLSQAVWDFAPVRLLGFSGEISTFRSRRCWSNVVSCMGA